MERISELRSRERPRRALPAHTEKKQPPSHDQFSLLLDKHGDAINAVIWHRFPNWADFLDVRQQVHLQMFRMLGQIKKAENVRAYLRRLANNQCLNVIKERNALSRRGTTRLQPGASDVLEHDLRRKRSSHSPMAALHHQELLDAFQRAVGKNGPLTKSQQQIIQAAVAHELSGTGPDYKALAKRFGISVEAAKNRVLNARKRLENALPPA